MLEFEVVLTESLNLLILGGKFDYRLLSWVAQASSNSACNQTFLMRREEFCAWVQCYGLLVVESRDPWLRVQLQVPWQWSVAASFLGFGSGVSLTKSASPPQCIWMRPWKVLDKLSKDWPVLPVPLLALVELAALVLQGHCDPATSIEGLWR